MGIMSNLFQKPTIEINQDRYEELVKKELKYEQYKQSINGTLKDIIEIDKKEI